MKAHAADAAAKKRKKGPAVHDFQLFDVDRLNAISEKERELAGQKEAKVNAIQQYREASKHAAPQGSGVAPGQSKEELLKLAEEMEQKLIDGTETRLTKEEEEEKARLQAEGFPDWNKKVCFRSAASFFVAICHFLIEFCFL